MRDHGNVGQGGHTTSKAAVLHHIGRVPLLGSGLRWLARQYREGSIVTIKSGCLAGCKWMRSHRHVNAYWVGNYELAIQKCLTQQLKAGDVFYDVGANAGFFSLLGSKCVGSEGRVFAFEPLPANIETLKNNLKLNGIENCTVVEAAVSDSIGTVTFSPGRHSSMGHMSDRGEDCIAIRTITLEKFAETMPPPNFIKMDIEGAEGLALAGCRKLLGGANPPGLLIELHGEQVARNVRELLGAEGYTLRPLKPGSADSPDTPYHVLAFPEKGSGR